MAAPTIYLEPPDVFWVVSEEDYISGKIVKSCHYVCVGDTQTLQHIQRSPVVILWQR